MKKIFSIFFISVIIFSCNSQSEKSITTEIINNPATANGETDTINVPKMAFSEEVYEFGSITQGEKVTHTFKFKNTGKTDLVITSAQGSCGCTVPSYPKNPISPNSEDAIEVTFDSHGKQGQQHKTVTIVANTYPSTTVIAIKGNVIAPEEKK